MKTTIDLDKGHELITEDSQQAGICLFSMKEFLATEINKEVNRIIIERLSNLSHLVLEMDIKLTKDIVDYASKLKSKIQSNVNSEIDKSLNYERNFLDKAIQNSSKSVVEAICVNIINQISNAFMKEIIEVHEIMDEYQFVSYTNKFVLQQPIDYQIDNYKKLLIKIQQNTKLFIESL